MSPLHEDRSEHRRLPPWPARRHGSGLRSPGSARRMIRSRACSSISDAKSSRAPARGVSGPRVQGRGPRDAGRQVGSGHRLNHRGAREARRAWGAREALTSTTPSPTSPRSGPTGHSSPRAASSLGSASIAGSPMRGERATGRPARWGLLGTLDAAAYAAASGVRRDQVGVAETASRYWSRTVGRHSSLPGTCPAHSRRTRSTNYAHAFTCDEA